MGGIGIGVNAHDYRGTIGYWVAASRTRAGHVHACAAAALTTSRSTSSSSNGVDLVTDPDNVASQRVAEKVGFRREGVLRSHLRHPDGRIRDSVMFSLLPGELRE